MSESPSTIASLDLNDSQRQALAELAGPAELEDVRDVLARAPDLEPRELVDLLVLDQAQRWEQGQRIPVETYLRLRPALGEDTDEAFELVYSEFVLRQELGDSPDPAEYAWRFPLLADRLRRQAGLFQTLVANEDQTPFTPSGQVREARPEPSAEWPRVEGFTIEGELGRGGMAVVYQARQHSLNRTVALKLIRDGALADAEQRKRFQREAEAVARLQHPNIVQIHAVGEQDGLPYLCLEYVAGGSLARALQGRPQAPQDAARLVETLARAVEHAHRQGIVHRDLKPANVLLVSGEWFRDEAGTSHQPKITDFGLAKRWNPGEAAAPSHTGAVVGTAEYMAPEQAQAQPGTVGPAADIYALGVILYELLTGRPPFKAAAPLDTLLLALQEEPVPPRRLQPTVPRDLETICLKCLEKSPHRRYATAEELAADLHRFLSGEPIRARPVRGWERTAKWARRRPALAALVAVSLVSGLSLGVFGVWHTQRLQEQKVRADDNLGEALAAIGRMVMAAEHLSRAGLPELDAAQRRILEEAIRAHETSLAHADNSTPQARLRHSLTHFELGRFRTILQQWDQARPNLEEALAVQLALVREYPQDRTYRRHLGITYGYHAWLWKPVQPERETELLRATQLLGEVLQATPEDREAKAELARVYHLLGHSYHLKRVETAEADASTVLLAKEEEAYRQALVLKEALLEEAPALPEHVCSLSATWNNLAITLFSKKDWKGAGELLERSARLLEGTVERGEPRPELTVQLLATYANLGSRADVTDQHADAHKWYSRVVKQEAALLPAVPRHYRYYLYSGHAGLAKSLANLNRPAEAIPHWDRAMELCPPEARAQLRFYRVYTLGQTDDHARATAEALAVAEADPANGPRLYYLAAVCAGAVKAAQGDAKLTMAERDTLMERYAVTALQLLEKVRAAGLFKDASQVARLEKDDSFAPLRDHPQFVRFLSSVRAAPNASQP